LIENKSTLIAQKMAATKHADGLQNTPIHLHIDKLETKALGEGMPDEFTVKVAINTTNFLDSHDDVHIDNIWNKSVRENRNILHLQEHKLEFNKIIADGNDLKVKVENFTWKELGFKYEGETQALVFESNVKKDRNTFMHKQYAEGRVKNHSVGMRYVKVDLAVNSDEYEKEKSVWDKYIDRIANKEIAIEQGFFWAVTEAKVIEGSAVPIGSNSITPTIETNGEPSKDTHLEPSQDTQYLELKSLIKSALKNG
jgi:hypothetical protein